MSQKKGDFSQSESQEDSVNYKGHRAHGHRGSHRHRDHKF